MEPEEHYVEVPKRSRGPFVKVFVALAIAALTFTAGVAVGKGYHNNPLASSPPNQLDYSSVDSLYGSLTSSYDGKLDSQKALDGLKSGLVEATGDPYTEYFNSKDAKAFNDQLSGSITGIGAELGRNEQSNIVIISPLADYPAEKAGLKPKDIVAAIDGRTTEGMTVGAAVSKIRGDAGTKVKLTIVRGSDKPFDVTITREKITVPSVKHEVIGNIGYLKISQFTSETADLAKKAADEFRAKKVKGVILDLRGDPGGYLDASVDISSLWLDEGKTVVMEKRGGQTVEVKYASGDNVLKGIPTVVLIDSGSASASEILAGALHDNKVATLVGEKSYGKGSVQEVKNFPDGSELKVTIARWFTPNNKNIDKQGISPDVVIKLSDKDAASGKDPQKDKAFELIKAKIQ